MEMRRRRVVRVVRADGKRREDEEEVCGWESAMTDAVDIVRIAVMLGIVAVLNVLCGCLLGSRDGFAVCMLH